MAAANATELAAAEKSDDFVIPAKYAQSMMLFQMASGGQGVITVPQLTMLAQMPLTMVMPKIKALFEEIKKGLTSGPQTLPANCIAVLDKCFNKVIADVTGNLGEFIKPFFGIVDLNDSGTISKKEFFHLACIGETIMGAGAGPPNAEQMKALLDCVFGLLDTDADAAISKDEIAAYIHRIMQAIGSFIALVLKTIRENLDQEIFSVIGAEFFKTAAKQEGCPPVFNESGNLAYDKVSPFLAKADEMMHAQFSAMQSGMQPSALGAMKTYLTLEKEFIDGVAAKADGDGKITAEGLGEAVKSSIGKMADEYKKQYLAMMSALPAEVQQPMMLVSGVVDPPALIKKVMTSDPFIYTSSMKALVDNFGTDGKLSIQSFSVLYNVLAGFVDPRTDTTTPEDRCKALFGLVDADADGSISADEAARIVGGVTRVTVAMISDVMEFYMRLLGDPALITGLCSAAEMAYQTLGKPMLANSPFASKADEIKFPIKKSLIEGFIAMMMGTAPGASGASKEDMIKAVFDYCDMDGDGMLTMEEWNRIEPGRVTKNKFSMFCQLGGTEGKVDISVFAKQYDNGVDLAADFAKLQAGDWADSVPRV